MSSAGGATLRDYFAGQALQGAVNGANIGSIIARLQGASTKDILDLIDSGDMVEVAFNVADRMLKAYDTGTDKLRDMLARKRNQP